jgi:hypothetical protein
VLAAAASSLVTARAAQAQPVPPLRIAVLVGANGAAPGRARLLFGHGRRRQDGQRPDQRGRFQGPQDAYVLTTPPSTS